MNFFNLILRKDFPDVLELESIKREVLINRNVFVPSKKIKGETLILTVSLDLTKQPEKISSWPWIKNVFKNWSIDAWLEKHRESIFSITLDIHKKDFYLAIETINEPHDRAKGR